VRPDPLASPLPAPQLLAVSVRDRETDTALQNISASLSVTFCLQQPDPRVNLKHAPLE